MNTKPLVGVLTVFFLACFHSAEAQQSTPRPRSHCAQAFPKISSRSDASTHRHRYYSMPSMPKGNSGLPCRPAHPGAVGFFVMIDRRTKDRAIEPLCARAHAPARPVSLLHVLLADSPLRFAIWSRPIVHRFDKQKFMDILIFR